MEVLKTTSERGKASAILAIIIFFYLVLTGIVDLLIYFFENGVNPDIQTPNDAFRVIENVFQLGYSNAASPVTTGGRIVVFVFLIISIVTLVLFVSQIVNLFTGKEVKRLEKEIDRGEEDLLDEIEVSQDLESEILDKQKEILSVEDNIMKKLDDLRDSTER